MDFLCAEIYPDDVKGGFRTAQHDGRHAANVTVGAVSGHQIAGNRQCAAAGYRTDAGGWVSGVRETEPINASCLAFRKTKSHFKSAVIVIAFRRYHPAYCLSSVGLF